MLAGEILSVIYSRKVCFARGVAGLVSGRNPDPCLSEFAPLPPDLPAVIYTAWEWLYLCYSLFLLASFLKII
jgi:hypothetical protein